MKKVIVSTLVALAVIVVALPGFAAAKQAQPNNQQLALRGNPITQTKEELASQQSSKPSSDLKSLDRLVGTWKLSGEAQGQISYEWMEGGLFLVQHFDFEHGGRKIKGIEVIGHLQRLGEEPSKEIRTRVQSFLDELTLDYVFELVGDTLTIGGGEKGSPAYYIRYV